MAAEAKGDLQTPSSHSEECLLSRGSLVSVPKQQQSASRLGTLQQQHGACPSHVESIPHDTEKVLGEMFEVLHQEIVGSRLDVFNFEQQWQQDLLEIKQTLVSIQQDVRSPTAQTVDRNGTGPSLSIDGQVTPTKAFTGDDGQVDKGSLPLQVQQKKNQLMSERRTSQVWSDFQEEVNAYDTDNAYQVVLKRRLSGKGFWHWVFRLYDREHVLSREMPKTALARATRHSLFTSGQALLILTNTVFVAYETDVGIKSLLEEPPAKPAHWITLVNSVFIILFTIELVFRMVALRGWFWVAAHDWAWNIFDVILVGFSLVSDVLLAGSNVTFIRLVRLVRVVRVARIIRVIRFLRQLRQILLSVLASLASLAWAFLFLVMVMFMFSILFLQGVTISLAELDWTSEHAQALRGDALAWFGSLGGAMLSLLAAVTGGTDWLDLKKQMDHAGPLYGGAFIAYILFITVGVMNVLTGVFLSNAGEFFDLDLIGQNEQAKVEAFIEQMLEVFNEIDLQHTGQIDWQTFRDALKHEHLKSFFASIKLEPIHLRLIFDLLDQKGEGKISMAEFVMSVVQMHGEAKAIDARIIQREISMLPMLFADVWKYGRPSGHSAGP